MSKPKQWVRITKDICERFRLHKLQEEMIVLWRKGIDLVLISALSTLPIAISICFCETVAIPQAEDETLLQARLLVGKRDWGYFLPRFNHANDLPICAFQPLHLF